MDPVSSTDTFRFNGSLADSLGTLLKLRGSSPIYGDQSKFTALKQEAILELSGMLASMKRTEPVNDDTENFKKVLEKAGELRRNIAIATGTPGADNFGSLRTSGDYMTTLLSTEEYKDVNKKIKELILTNIPFLKNKQKPMRSTLKNSRYTFKVQKEDELTFQNPLKPFLEVMTGGDYNWGDEQIVAMDHIINYKNGILPLLHKLKNEEVSKSEILLNQNMYVFTGRIELNIDEKWRTLTRHFAIINCDSAGEINAQEINDFKLHGIAHLLHTNCKELKFHEKPMARLFNEILNSSTPPEQLQLAMRQFEYRLHHLVYFIRGSAATNEIILEALKLACNVQYDLKGNLEALAEPYISKY